MSEDELRRRFEAGLSAEAMQAVVDYADAGRQYGSLSTDQLNERYLQEYHELAAGVPTPELFKALEDLQSEMTLRGEQMPTLPEADVEAIRSATIDQHRQIYNDPLASAFRRLKMQDTIDLAKPAAGQKN